MKRMSLTAMLLMSLFLGAQAETITVKVTNVKNNQGNVLVMAQPAGDAQPAYGLAKAEKGTTVVLLEDLAPGEYSLSIMHDENGNMQMDMSDDQRPNEGYAMKKCKADGSDQTINVKFFYPVNP